MKFLFDENIDDRLRFLLSKLGHDIKLTPKSIINGEVFKLALSEQRLILSRDKHFTQPPFSESEHFGIWLLRVPVEELELQKKSILNVLNNLSPEDCKGKILKLLPDSYEHL